ncbi:MAG: sensor domain-containing protein [Magnetovibrionaceae bacterium]
MKLKSFFPNDPSGEAAPCDGRSPDRSGNNSVSRSASSGSSSGADPSGEDGGPTGLNPERALLEALTASAPFAILVVNNEGLIEKAGEAFCRMLGQGFADILGRRATDLLFSANSREEAMLHLEQLIRDPAEETLETWPLDASGTPKKIRWDTRPIDGLSGPLLLMIGQDETKLDQLTTRLRDTEASLKAYLLHQHDVLMELDTKGVILRTSGPLGILNRKPGEILTGKALADLADDTTAKTLRESLASVDLLTPEIETEISWPAGDPTHGGQKLSRITKLHIRALFDAKSAVTGYQVTGRDITRERQLELTCTQLRERIAAQGVNPGSWPGSWYGPLRGSGGAESGDGDPAMDRQAQLLAHAEEVARFGHWYWDIKEDRLFWSMEACRLRGLIPDNKPVPLETALGSFHPEDRHRISKALRDAADSGEPFAFESRLVHTDGSARHVSCRGDAEKDLSGAVIGLFCVFQDVTESKETERQLRQAKEEAEQANQSKTDFMARLSHEFRTPLNNIIGFSESISMEILGRMEPPAYRDYVENILESGKDLVRSLDQLTDVKLLEDILQREESSYRDLVELSPDLICICTNGRIKLINSAGAGILRAWSADDLKGRQLSDFVFAESREGLKIALRSHGQQKRRIPITFLTMTGQQVALEVSAVALKNEDFEGIMIVGRDVTDRNTALETAIAREKRLQAVMDSVLDAIVTMDVEGVIQDCNSAVERIFGYRPEQLIGSNISRLMPPDHAERHAEYVQRYINTGAAQAMFRGRELTALHRDGTEIPVMITLSEVFDASKRLFTGVIRNLSENKQLSEKVRYLANYDSATDLPNRALVEDRISQAIAFANRAGREVAVLAFQINEFSMVTGTLGHGGGDDMLRQISERLMGCIRPADTVGRTGTNEFMIIAANLAATTDVNFIVDRVNQAMEKPLIVRDQEIHVTCASGASLYPKDGERPEELLRNATTALNVARPLGAGAFGFFDTAMTAEVAERLTLERDLKHAIEREEFKLYYQPQMDLVTGRVIGAEALVRWQHPRLGFVMPNRFISVAEQTGQIIEIGNWVMREAVRQQSAWRDQGIDSLRIGINLSARQFRDNQLLPNIESVLKESNLDPGLFDFELTESLLMTDTDGAVETVRALKDIGVSVSVDDFGTGYSSLAYLKRFKVDTLKIDQAFVREIDTSGDDEAIATAVISLGHSLNLNVIAEGVEHMGQVEALRAHDCDEIQGYILSRPLPAEEFAAALPQISLPDSTTINPSE